MLHNFRNDDDSHLPQFSASVSIELSEKLSQLKLKARVFHRGYEQI